ncbi:ATP-binding protein [Synechocystis sp. PCC 7509]|uniref:ATP-binding protein n=1 Tax=Synechocystis sp. PCC 7509 TaxID=927677 RepID=UPI0002AC2F22|nr:ATP-binding protein [Synechocystis sp. PCC 7509]
MTTPVNITAETLDLTNCDREPIHIPGLIQSHGVLLVLKEPELQIIQVSSNTKTFLGQEPEQLLNTKLQQLLDEDQIQVIAQCLDKDFESVNPLKISVNNIVFDGVIHRFDNNLILELEPTQNTNKTEFLDFYKLVVGSVNKLQVASTPEQICQEIVKEIRVLTQCDRVMVYQLDPEGSGKVVAEDKQEHLTPFLGLKYPATDIPKQAKHLYTLNWLRLIPDINYQTIELIPPLNPLTNSPTDLSLSVLRSVSPLHVEYLHNMGVAASMSVSLIKNGQLWGLIACHHHSPKYIPYEVRTACEFLGKVTSMQLVAKEENQDLDYKVKLKSISSKFVESIGLQKTLLEGLVAAKNDLLGLTSAQGIAIYWQDEIFAIGKTPDIDQLQDLGNWIQTKLQDNLFHTNTLAKEYPIAEKYTDVASGIVALAISRTNKNYVLWFRPEVVQTVSWGGNPDKPVEVDEKGGMRLSPRKSFELWQQTVKNQSLPWKKWEIEAVLELRGAIVSTVLRQADELAKINIELQQSNTELDAFAYVASHDLKEPLRGIHNYSNFLIEDYGNILNEDGVSKLQTLVRLSQRMEDLINSLLHFSRLGRVELAISRTNLNDILQQVLDLLRARIEETGVSISIPRPLPIINCDRIQVTEVFTNLISNAIKYSDRPEKWVEVGYLDHQEEATVFYVRDNGIGIKEQYLDNIFRIFKRLHGHNHYGGGTGAGLTIVKKIVERHGGKIWVESTFGQGSTFYFTLQA